MIADLHLPDYDGGSIVNLAASILTAFGAEPPAPPLRPELLPASGLSGDGGIVLLVLDALGLASLQAALASGRTPQLARLADAAPRGVQRLTSVFPSTTTAALNSLATACPPAAHGILGHMMWLEEVDAVVNMLTFRRVGDVAGEPLSHELVRRVPTVYERLQRVGVPSTLITEYAFEGTPFTNLLQEGARFTGYVSLSQLCFQLAGALAASEGRAFYSLYWPAIDTLSHYHGPDSADTLSEACRLEMEFIDLMVGKVAALCRRHGCDLVVVADHGQTRLDPAAAVTIEGGLCDHLSRPPGGGRRAPYLHTDDPEGLLQDEGLVRATAALRHSDDAVQAGWFGGPCPEVRARLGDVVALADEGRQLLYDYGAGTYLQHGSHAGMTAAEMHVPLIAVPAD